MSAKPNSFMAGYEAYKVRTEAGPARKPGQANSFMARYKAAEPGLVRQEIDADRRRYEDMGGGTMYSVGRGVTGLKGLGQFAGMGLEKAVTGRTDYFGPKFTRTIETLNRRPGDPIGGAIERSWDAEGARGVVRTIADNPQGLKNYIIEMMVGALPGGLAGGLLTKKLADEAVKRVVLPKVVQTYGPYAMAGAGANTGATAVGGLPLNIAGAYGENPGDLSAAIRQGLRQTGAESAVAAPFGAVLPFGRGVAPALGKALVVAPVDEMAQTAAGNLALGRETTGGQLAAAGLLGAATSPIDIATATWAARQGDSPRPASTPATPATPANRQQVLDALDAIIANSQRAAPSAGDSAQRAGTTSAQRAGTTSGLAGGQVQPAPEVEISPLAPVFAPAPARPQASPIPVLMRSKTGAAAQAAATEIPPAPAPEIPLTGSLPAAQPAGDSALAEGEELRGLTEGLIRQMRDAKQTGLDRPLRTAIDRLKKPDGVNEKPAYFTRLAKEFEKRGDARTAGMLGQVADTLKARQKALRPAVPKPAAPPSARRAGTTSADEFSESSRREFLRMVKAMGGITVEEARDITGEPAHLANRMLPGLFRKQGNALDLVARRLHEAGYITDEQYNDVDGGVQAARDLIGQALAREFVGALEQRDNLAELEAKEADAAAELQGEAEQADMDAILGLDITEDEFTALHSGIQADETADQTDADRAAQQENDDVSRRIAEGQTDTGEAQPRGAEANPQGGESQPGRAAVQGADGAGQGARPDLSLARQTERDLAARERELNKREAEQNARERAALDKEKADRERDGFRLTGSDRAADANAGQGDLPGVKQNEPEFDRSAADTPPPARADVVPARRADTPFYSQLSRVIESAPGKVFTTANQFKAWLSANAAKLGVKKDEIAWSGIEEYLTLRGEAKVSKADIVAFLNESGVKVEDKDNLKYSDIVPPGGIPGTYRETLVTVPERQHPMDAEIRSLGITKPLNEVSFTDVVNAGGSERLAGRWMDSFSGIHFGENFISPHFDQKNILVHLRTDRVKTADGRTFMRVVELQSEWHQARTQGKNVPDAPFSDTKAWVSLGIKKAIQQAVDSDVDGIVFATGKQNADLYDLSKKVGGEGMRVFYDEIVPSVANEVLKKLGIGRIAKVAVHDAQGLHNSIILTDTVRAKTRAEGLPLFQNIVKPEETPHTDPYDNLETRPNTSPEQLDTGRDALVSAERRIFGANRTGLLQDATLLGSAISKEFRENGGVSLVGQTIKGSRDLAVLAQVLRDPRFETFRVVYVDESNKIIKEGVYSSRLPGAVYLPQDIAAQIKADKEKVGAAGYWLMHNHPSGSSRESTQDLRLTERVSAMAPGFKGHVVIDHNEYNIIDVDFGRAFGQVVKDPSLGSIDLTANPEKSHPILGEQITSTESLAKLAKRLQQKDGYAVVIGVDAQSRVTFIAEVPDSDIRKARSVKALALVKRSMRETGSMALFAAVPDSPINYGSLIDSMIFTDIVQIESGESAAKNGWMKDKNIPVTKVEQRGAKAYSGQKPFGVASPETEYDAAGKGPRQTAGWRDELGRVQFAPAVRLKDAGKRALADFAAKGEIRQYLYNAFKLAPPKLQIAIRKMKAAEQRALELTDDVMRPAVSMTPQEAALISDVVEIMVKPGVYPPEHIVAVAERLRTIMNLETDELVETGMLREETAARWRGKYLPRFYDRKKDLLPETWGKIPGSRDVVRGMGGEHLKARGLPPMTVHVSEIGKWEALGWEVRDPAWDYRNGKLELKHPDKYLNDPDTVRMWRDYTPTERENMGEIRDARFRFAMGYTAMQKDIALGRLFDTIARNQEWTRPRAEEGYVHVPDTEIADTGGLKRYGNLAGLYVRKDIMSHLTQYGDSNKFLMQYREAMSVWKMGMVPMNPVSHVNNTVSNLTMAHLAGVSYWDGHKYAAALHDLSISAKNKKDEPMVQEARDIGLFTGDITRAEIYNEMPESLRDMMNMQESRLKKGAWLAYDLSTYFARRPMLAAYRFEDDFFKYLIYRDARNHGLKPEDAMIYATQYIFNYDDLPEGARAVRDTIIPFFAYTYKATPALIHAATHYPWRFLAPSVILSGYSMAVYSAMVMRMGAGGDDDMWDIWNKARELKAEDQKGLAPWERGKSIFLTDKTFRTGATDDRTGLPVFQNIYRWLPGGDLLDIRHGEMTTLPAPLMPSNPILSIAAATIPQINKNMFTGDEVVDETDTAAEVTKKRIHYVLRTLAPAISPTGYHADRLLNATANALDKTIETPFKDYTGVSKDGLPVQAKYAVAQSLGFKMRPVDLERQAEFEVIGDRAKVRKIKSELRSAARQRANGNISERQYQSELKKAKEKLARIGKEE